MDHKKLDEIFALARSGAHIALGTDFYGKCKVKVRYGFLKLRIKRFTVDAETFATLKTQLDVQPRKSVI